MGGGRGGEGEGGEGEGGSVVRRTTENVSIKLNFYFLYFLKYIFVRGRGEGGRAVVGGITEYKKNIKIQKNVESRDEKPPF